MTDPTLIPAARIVRVDAAASPRRMGALLTGAAVMLAVVLATALPARAKPDTEDVLKTILGLAIIGALADQADRNDDDQHIEYDRDRYKPEWKHDKKRKKGATIPAACAIQISGKKRDAVVYSESCLRRAGVTRNLPYQCSNEAKIYGRWDTIFSEQCLRNAGFRLVHGPND